MKQSATTKAALPEMLILRNPGGEFWRIEDENGKRVADFGNVNETLARAVRDRYNAHEVLMQHWRESECYCADYVAAKGSCAHCAVRAALAQLERPA